ncbi:MAG TPA: UDP-4-amino-4,6-dideoxy-N-acetyl-beta-L-altrosamine N-acetyltransferase [Bacillales bacterium]
MRFVTLSEEHLETVLKWRTSEFVTKYMYTDVEYDMEKQREWFRRVKQDPHSYYWVLENKGVHMGLVSITDIDNIHKRAYWNFYIGEPKYGMLAGFIGPYLYNFAYERFKLNKLMGEVMAGNESVRTLHLKQGAREVGCFKDHIWKNGKFHDVYIYEMTKEDWLKYGDKYSKYQPEVETGL